MRPLQGRKIGGRTQEIGVNPYPILCAPYRGNQTGATKRNAPNMRPLTGDNQTDNTGRTPPLRAQLRKHT